MQKEIPFKADYSFIVWYFSTNSNFIVFEYDIIFIYMFIFGALSPYRYSTCTWSSIARYQWRWRFSVRRSSHHHSGRHGNSLQMIVRCITML